MIRRFAAVAAVTALLGSGGCTSTSGFGGSGAQDGPAADADATGYEYQSTRDGGVETFGYNDGAGFTDSGFDGGGIGPATASVGRTVYFDYDSAEIREASRQVIEAHVNYLLQNPQVSILLEGHTDERGTRGYNMALGERRGMAVRELMLGLGVAPRQVSVVSYGEEQPADDGLSEQSYALNRRVEIAY